MYPNPQMPPMRPPRRPTRPRNIVIAVIGAFVLLAGGCTAGVALAGSGGDPSAKPVAAAPTASSPTPAGKPSRSITPTPTRPENTSAAEPGSTGATDDPGDDDPGTTTAPDVPAVPDDDPAVTPDDHPAHTGGTATFTVTGTAPDGVDITYGNDSSNLNGDGPPFKTTMKVKDDALYYAVTAQLQGSGHIHCSVTINGKTKSGEAKGGYNICSAQLNSGLSGEWD